MTGQSSETVERLPRWVRILFKLLEDIDEYEHGERVED